MLRTLQAEDRPATETERATLARWGSWGATGVAEILDESRTEHEAEQAELRELLNEAEYAAARRTVINAHYTDPMIAAEGPTGRKRGSLDPGLTGVHRRLSCPGLHVLVPNVGPPIATGRATVFPLVNPTVGGDDELIIVFA